MNDVERILSLPQAVRKKFFDELDFYTYALCELGEDNKRNPFYIGKGKKSAAYTILMKKKIQKRRAKLSTLLLQKN